MPGQFERRTDRNEFVALQLIGDQILFAPIGNIEVAAVGTESDPTLRTVLPSLFNIAAIAWS